MTQSVYGHLKWCAHIASTVQNEGPLPRTQGGAWDMNSFAYVQQVSTSAEMNNSKDQILTKLLHRSQWEKVYKSTESLKNVIHILGNANQSHWPIVTLLHRLVRLLLDYRYAQEEDSKWEQMIYLWRGLTLKQILENERTVKPLTIKEWRSHEGRPFDPQHSLFKVTAKIISSLVGFSKFYSCFFSPVLSKAFKLKQTGSVHFRALVNAWRTKTSKRIQAYSDYLLIYLLLEAKER